MPYVILIILIIAFVGGLKVAPSQPTQGIQTVQQMPAVSVPEGTLYTTKNRGFSIRIPSEYKVSFEDKLRSDDINYDNLSASSEKTGDFFEVFILYDSVPAGKYNNNIDAFFEDIKNEKQLTYDDSVRDILSIRKQFIGKNKYIIMNNDVKYVTEGVYPKSKERLYMTWYKDKVYGIGFTNLYSNDIREEDWDKIVSTLEFAGQ